MRRPYNVCMESASEFNSAHADACSLTVAFKKTARISQVKSTSAGGDYDENIHLFFASEEDPSNHEEAKRSSRAQQNGEHSSDGEHIDPSSNYEGAKRPPQAEQRQAVEKRNSNLLLEWEEPAMRIDSAKAETVVE